MHPPMNRPMHGPACPSTKIPIQPQLNNMDWDYTILLLYIRCMIIQKVNKFKFTLNMNYIYYYDNNKKIYYRVPPF